MTTSGQNSRAARRSSCRWGFNRRLQGAARQAARWGACSTPGPGARGRACMRCGWQFGVQLLLVGWAAERRAAGVAWRLAQAEEAKKAAEEAERKKKEAELEAMRREAREVGPAPLLAGWGRQPCCWMAGCSRPGARGSLGCSAAGWLGAPPCCWLSGLGPAWCQALTGLVRRMPCAAAGAAVVPLRPAVLPCWSASSPPAVSRLPPPPLCPQAEARKRREAEEKAAAEKAAREEQRQRELQQFQVCVLCVCVQR